MEAKAVIDDASREDVWPGGTAEEIDATLSRQAKMRAEGHGGNIGPMLIPHEGKWRTWNDEKQCVEVRTEKELFRTALSSGMISIEVEKGDFLSNKIARFVGAARQLGIEVPPGLILETGEIFWRDEKVEEVRLAGVIDPGFGAEAGVSWSEIFVEDSRRALASWSTATAPRCSVEFEDGLFMRPSLFQDPAEEGRSWEGFAGTHRAVHRALLCELPAKIRELNGLLNPYRFVYAWDLYKDSSGGQPPQSDAPGAGPVAGLATAARAPRAPQVPSFPVRTSQEFDALQRAACDGRKGSHYLDNPQAGTRTHAVPGLSHYVQLALLDEEIAAGMDITLLENLTFAQDADCTFVLLYVSRCLLPTSPGPLPPDLYAGGWVVLDDIIKKIGWKPRSTKDREAMRERVWQYLLFGARASVIGQRTGKYIDPDTGKEIETRINGPLWSFLKRETAADSPENVQPTLFPTLKVPLSVEVLVSREWTRLCQSSRLAEYLPMGEVLGAIAPDQPSGSWARVLGLSLGSFWRRQPRAALDGSINPTRRELLERYRAKISPCDEVLAGNDPKRAIKYWRSALQVLAESGFVAREGEAARSVADIEKSLPRYHWQDVWLGEPITLLPGPKMREAVQERAAALPARKPRALRGAKRRATNSKPKDK